MKNEPTHPLPPRPDPLAEPFETPPKTQEEEDSQEDPKQPKSIDTMRAE
jgi:hypothetical protein